MATKGKQDCDCIGSNEAGQCPPDRVAFKHAITRFGPVDLTAERDCPDCGGTGYAPDGVEFRKAARLLVAYGWTVTPPDDFDYSCRSY